jgi:hypothetical protein
VILVREPMVQEMKSLCVVMLAWPIPQRMQQMETRADDAVGTAVRMKVSVVMANTLRV